MAKTKVQKTSRIRITAGENETITTLYVSTEIIRETREFTFRLQNNVMVPQRGMMSQLKTKLVDLLDEKPEHFSGPAKDIIANMAS